MQIRLIWLAVGLAGIYLIYQAFATENDPLEQAAKGLLGIGNTTANR